MRNILEIRDLQVHYGGIEAVRGISLDVPEGEIVTLILSLIHISEPTRPY